MVLLFQARYDSESDECSKSGLFRDKSKMSLNVSKNPDYIGMGGIVNKPGLQVQFY